MDYEAQEKKLGRLATAFSIFSALSLLICAAFGPQMHNRLGIPTEITYGFAILAGILTLLLNLGSNAEGISAKWFALMAHAYTCLASVLTQAAVIFTFMEYKGFTNQSVMTALIFMLFYVGAIFFLYRLVAALKLAQAAPEQA